MKVKEKSRELMYSYYENIPFSKIGYKLVSYYKIDDKILWEAKNLKTGYSSIFSLRGKQLYGGDHYKIEGFEIINGVPFLTVIHDIRTPAVGNYYLRNGKAAFGGYDYKGGQEIDDGDRVYRTKYWFINRIEPDASSLKPKVVSTIFSLSGKKFGSLDEVVSNHPVMGKFLKIGLFDQGEKVYYILTNFLYTNRVDDEKTIDRVVAAFFKSMKKILNDNKKDKDVQRAAVSEALSSLRHMIEKHPTKFIEGLGVIRR